MNQVAAGTLLLVEGVRDSPGIKQKAESVYWENIRGVLAWEETQALLHSTATELLTAE